MSDGSPTAVRLTFELRVRREVYAREDGRLVRQRQLDHTVDEVPTDFNPVRGDYPRVAAVAVHMNKREERRSVMRYLYFPEPVSEKN